MEKRPLVVVPIDSSPDRETAVEYAVALAKRRGADVHLLQVEPPRRPSVLDSADLAVFGQTVTSDRTADRARAAAAEDDLSAIANVDAVHIQHVTHQGQPARAIVAYAQLSMAGVIVVGKHYGASRWGRSTAVASAVGRSAPAPVLIVPPRDNTDAPLNTGPFTNIVSAVDFNVSSAVALRTAVDLARTSGGRVTMVHALKTSSAGMVLSGGEAVNAIDEIRADAAHVAARLRREIPADATDRVDARVTTGDPAASILAVASEVRADLVVMGVPPRGRVDEVLFGSTLRTVVRRAAIPVLVLPVVAGAHEWLAGATAAPSERGTEPHG